MHGRRASELQGAELRVPAAGAGAGRAMHAEWPSGEWQPPLLAGLLAASGNPLRYDSRR